MTQLPTNTYKSKTTPRQREVLEHLRGGAAHPYSMRHRSMGGAFRRMIDDMRTKGLLDFDSHRVRKWEITAKGLLALGVSSGVRAAREALEAQRQAAAQRGEAAFAAARVKREAERKAKIVAKVRKDCDAILANLDDGPLWQLIERIAEIEQST